MDETVRPAGSRTAFLSGNGEMARLIRRHDWAATSLGPVEAWPQVLRTAVDIMLHSPEPVSVLWGPGHIQLYNDAYIAVASGRHPASLGRPAAENWGEAYHAFLQPIFDRVFAGETVTVTDQKVHVPRPGGDGLAERSFTASFSPVHDAEGAVAGIFHPVTETTDRVLAEDRLRQTELRLNGILGGMGEAFGLLDRDFRILAFNEAALRLESRPREAIVGRSHWEVYPGTERDEVGQLYRRALAEGRPLSLEHRHTAGDGTSRWLETRACPVPEGLAVFWRDISARKDAEAALRESEARLRFLSRLDDALRLASSAPDAMRAAAELLARELGASRCAYADVDPDSDRFVIRSDWSVPGLESSAGTYSLDLFGSRAAADMRGGRTLVVRDVRGELAADDGRETFLSIGIDAIVCCPLVKGGRLVAMMAVHQSSPRDWRAEEIGLVEAVVERCWAHVERVGAEARLRASEARYRSLFESIESGFCVVEVDLEAQDGRADYRVVEANPAFYRQTGFPQGILGPWLREAVPALEEHWYEVYARVARTGQPERFEQGSDHLGRWFDVHAFPIGEPEQHRVAILFNDISARRLAQERLSELNETLEARVAERTAALADSERRFRAIFDTAFQLSGLGALDGTILVVNQAALDAVRATQEQVAGLKIWEAPWWAASPEEARRVRESVERVAAGEFVRYETALDLPVGRRSFDFSLKPILNESGQPVLMVAEGRDITELKQTEEALRQSQKLESMGQLTGGVAHDFNNLLTPIIASLDMLLRRGVGSERERRLMDGALQSAERAKVLVQRLLAFARRQPLQPGPVDVGRLVGGMAELIARTSGPRVDVRTELAPDLPPALADANQLEMALLNLAVNARDAMPEGGRLTIAAARESVLNPHHPGKLRPGHYVRLSVSDTGTGMDEATLARAVEPFFSTKGVGRGTGLGLSMVHGLASQLGGALELRSRPGEGTTVELWLPLSARPVEEDEAASRPDAVPRALGTALLVDDEDLVRLSTADMLMDLGYEVVEARSGEEALRLVETGLRPDLVVTDHLMPGLSGVDLARDLRAVRPDLPVLIVSGYAEMDGMEPGLPRLTKPFRAAELAASLATLRPADAT